MNRSLFRVVSLLLWAVAAAGVVASWDVIMETAEAEFPRAGIPIVVLFIVIAALGLLVVQAWIADSVVKHDDPNASRQLSPEELRAEAEKKAREALEKGDKKMALRIYEGASLFPPALELARELQDKSSLGRLYSKSGNHDRARRYYMDSKNYEAAAQASALLGEIDVARELYKEAAIARAAEGITGAVLAGLHDRAGEYAKAAKHYEDDQEWLHAAECYELVGDKSNARRCDESSRLLKAIERRRSGGGPEPSKAELKQSGEMRETMGDFLGAGFFFREVDQMMEAAICFERYQDWERAARAYAKAGLEDRAAMARSRVVPPPAIPEEIPEQNKTNYQPQPSQQSVPNLPPTSAPVPSMISHSEFKPLKEQSSFVPVYSQSAGEPVSGEMALKIAQRVRRGNFVEAAQFALEARDWLMAAALFEQAGDLVTAADVYRQIGKVNDAMFCLERANRSKDAIMLSLASGDYQRSMKMLAEAVEASDEPELNLVYSELLAQRGEPDRALEVLRARIAPDGLTEETSEAYYRMARRFEENDRPRQALELYREMLKGGAEADDLYEREKRLSEMVGEQPLFKQPTPEENGGKAGAPDFDFMSDSELAAIGDRLDVQPGNGNAGTSVASVPRFAFKVPVYSATVLGKNRTHISLFGAPGLSNAEASLDLVESHQPATGAVATVQKAPLDPFSGKPRYDVKREIARGGMGIIYEAEDTVLGRPVALKLIQNDSASTEEFQQFLLEARAIARLNHPNVVTVYDIGLLDYKHYITMELITGGSLENYVIEHGPLPVKQAIGFFIAMSRGLQKAHESGVVHRDIKPGNLLLSNTQELKIVDFGLAKLGANEADNTGETIFKMSGTPGYMAPEVIQGLDSMPRSDIYAAGVTLFFMLIGKPPHVLFNKTKPRQIAAFQLAGALPKLREHRPEVPTVIDELYQFCTAATPESRYQAVEDYLSVADQWYETTAG